MSDDEPFSKCGATEGDQHGWAAVAGHEDMYEVNRVGHVRSYRPWRGKPLPRLLTPSLDSYGYPSVNLNGRRFGIHRIVMLTFVGPRPADQEIRHLDGQPTHNCLANLRYGTKSENQFDRVQHGTHQFAKQTHCKNGHEFTPENTMLERGGTKRSCRMCKRAHWHRWATASGRKQA